MKNIFLTGATGSIGSALVPRLLADQDALLTMLIRAKDEGALRARFGDMLAYWQYVPGDSRASRIRPLRGDIALPGFALSVQDQARLAAETTHIIHCAASVKLNMSLDEARATAVLPTRTVIELGRRAMLRGVLRKIDLVSTVGVWGRTPGAMPERPLPEVTDFHNTYEAAKADAERVVWAEGQGLPVTVHRPSMVVGDSVTGRAIHFQIFYHLCEFLSGARTYGVIPHLGQTRLDTVPVDWVADAICWANEHDESVGRIFHLCTGPQGAITLLQLQQLVRQIWRESGYSLPQLRMVNRRLLEHLVPLIGAIAGAKTRRALRSLPPVLAYLAEDQAFLNQETLSTLAAAGLPVPAVESYVGPVLSYYLGRRPGRHGV